MVGNGWPLCCSDGQQYEATEVHVTCSTYVVHTYRFNKGTNVKLVLTEMFCIKKQSCTLCLVSCKASDNTFIQMK